MKFFCQKCFDWHKMPSIRFTVMGYDVCGHIVCPACDSVVAEFKCDDDEWEYDIEPEGYYDIKKIPDYYPNGG